MRGWVLDYGSPGAGATYVAHSVVADPQGRLLDVTKNDEAVRHFLENLGALQVYRQHVSSGRWAIVREPIEIPPEWNWSAD